MYKLLLSGLLMLILGEANGQEYPDRHNTSLQNSWLSCQVSTNPNPDRPASHWIQYDLGTTYALGTSQFWNLNAYEHTDEGVRDLQIDYSLDGITWTNFGRYSLSQAEAKSTYEGEPGPDLNGIVARYLLITATSNYGGACYGFSEFKVASTPVTISDVEDLSLDVDIQASPNPFSDYTTIELSREPNDQTYYRLSDATGRIITIQRVNSASFTVNADGLVSGVYNLTVFNGQGQRSIPLNVVK